MTSSPAIKSFLPVIDRSGSNSISGQISAALRSAILDGRLPQGARLPSWNDLADQLGVARGTVRAAYDTLADELLVASAGASGTRVRHEGLSSVPFAAGRPLPPAGGASAPLPFQLGLPAQDALPAKLWSRLCARAARREAASLEGRPDPRGSAALREQIAAMLAITRSVSCTPDQVFLTTGYGNGLWLTIQVLEAAGKQAWHEDPGCPLTRKRLGLAGVDLVPVPVDQDGIRVDHGLAIAPTARLAVVTPSAQAPTGASLSQQRRKDLLGWAEREGAWIVEDDSLGGLQLVRPSAPALAAQDAAGRVILIGAFDMTLSPTAGLGYVVAPKALSARFAQVAAALNPAPGSTSQAALADFIGDGHYLRHLRQMKRLYRDRKAALEAALQGRVATADAAPLALSVRLAAGVDDVALARRALDFGIAPAPLSSWRHDRSAARPGLLLGVTNVHAGNLDAACAGLLELVS